MHKAKWRVLLPQFTYTVVSPPASGEMGLAKDGGTL